MINIGFNTAILLGIFILFAVFVLFFLRIIKYNLSRDLDLFFSTLGVTYSCIIILNGWRLDPILLLSQVLIFIILCGIGWENIRLRGIILKKEEEKDK